MLSRPTNVLSLVGVSVLECPPNCYSCAYSVTAGATTCSHCYLRYAKRDSDGLCYGKYCVCQL